MNPWCGTAALLAIATALSLAFYFLIQVGLGVAGV
jgi:hypothetical protein